MSKNTEPSDSALEETPAKALKFLMAVGTNPNIEAALARRGFTPEEKEEGWSRLFVVTGYRRPTAALLANPAAREALAEVDQWDNRNFDIIKAILVEDFRAQCDFLFDNDLEPGEGEQSIVAVSLLLDRLDQLETGKDRPKPQRKADLAALEKLGRRGYPPAERARLRKLIATAKGGKGEGAKAEGAGGGAAPLASEARRKALRSLWAWLNEWKTIAKAEITRRDWLISLGVVARKAAKKAAAKKDGAKKDAAPKVDAPKAETPKGEAAKPAPNGHAKAEPNGGEE